MNIPLFNKRLLTLPLLICFSLLLCVSANAYAALDYGDAPESYGDAAHTIVTGLHLGATPGDAEADSQHSYNAFGDGDFQSDGAGNWYLSGDEDGAPRQPVSDYIPLFPILKMTAMTYSADFTVTNTLGNTATLFGWIDFDGNGSFEADEGTSVFVSNGSNQSSVSLNWNVPVDIKAGTTFIRLRLTSDSSINTATPTGTANNGEVEDFTLAVALDIPPDSTAVTVISGETPLACQTTVFADDFDDVPAVYGDFISPNRGAGGGNVSPLRDWTINGGGADTYAHITSVAGGSAVYLGNGAVRRISPAIGSGFTFDAQGRVTNTIDAIELRDAADDSTPGNTLLGTGTAAHWGPEPLTLSRSFATTVGKTYRLYFKAVPEDPGGNFVAGAMRVDVPGGGVHFKIPGSNENTIDYAIEFVASNTTSTITFVNYGHVNSRSGLGWCDPASEYNNNPWCTVGGGDFNGNELIIDDVVVAESSCGNGNISGFVFTDSNSDDTFTPETETGISAMAVTLFDDQGTPEVLTDDVQVASTSSAADGSYTFSNVNAGTSYRIQIDTTDTDLPPQLEIGTVNPLTGVTVADGSNTSGRNFGFDPVITTCPAGQLPLYQKGHAAAVTLDQGVAYETQALGAPGAAGVTPDSSNAALVAKNDVLILDLQQLIPGQTPLTIKLGRNNNGGRLGIATSVDNVSYSDIGSYGNNGTLGNGNLLEFANLTITIPASGARYIRFIREGGGTWVDAVTYHAICAPETDLAEISGTVFEDSNQNDVHDSGSEAGISAIEISLFDDSNGSLVKTTTTDINGGYRFAGLAVDRSYRLRVSTYDASLPAGATLGTANPLTGLTLTAGSTLNDQDFGFDVMVPAVYSTVGEYRFDDCAGDGSWNLDSSGNSNTVAGAAEVIQNDFKNYGCTSVKNSSWNMEIPHHASYEVDSGAISMLIYDHHNVWADTRLIDKGWSSDKKLNLTATQAGSALSGTITAELNQNVISTGEVYFTTLNNGSDDDTQWTHVMLTFGGDGMKLYINGELKGTNAYTGGIREVPGNIRLPGMSGYFDELYILDGQPNDFQVQAIYDNLVANRNLDNSERSCSCKDSYVNNYCVTPDTATGLLDLSGITTVNGSGVYTYPDRVLPGFGTVDLSINMSGGIHNADASAIDNGSRQQSWLDEGLAPSGAAVYLAPNSNGSAVLTYDFDQPTGNIDLLLLDFDFEDTVTLSARDGAGNPITDFSGWRYRSGDMSVWQNPDPVDALPPAWDSATATVSSTDPGNDHRSFGLLTPDTLVTQIVVTYNVPAFSGRHIYSTLFSTTAGRDGDTSCPAMDYSDAPLSFGVASHLLSGGSLYLGAAAPDADGYALSSDHADGDDNNGDDEDGVGSFPALLATSSSYGVNVAVTNNSAQNATLHGWIDFDHNGRFVAGEHTSTVIAAGANNATAYLSWSGLNNNVAGDTFVRFRLTTDTLSAADAETAASDGEVEDYPLTIEPGVSSLTPLSCDTTLYQSHTNNALRRLDFDNGDYVIVNDDNANVYPNGVGYNRLDHYAYAIKNGMLIRIGANGVTEEAGAITGAAIDDETAGDMDASGNLWTGTADGSGNIYRINVTTRVATLLNFPGSGGTSGGDYIYFADKLYQVGSGVLTTWDLTAGTRSQKNLTGPLALTGTFGALWIDIQGRIYGHNNADDAIYQIVDYDTAAPRAVLIANVATIGTNDGFNCPVIPSIFADWGDAPDTYQTLRTSNGPAHIYNPAIFLGTGVSEDINGFKEGSDDNGNATDDDLDDGVTLPVLKPGQPATVAVNVSGANAYLQGWIDWNADGDFADSGEQIAVDLQLASGSAGTINIPVTVPVNAVTGQTFARFRWSTDIGLGANGAASDGEAEDYAISVIPSTTQPPFTCDANIYIASSADENNPAQFYSVNTAFSPFALNTIGNTAHGFSFNAMGYREQDDYIYAIQQSGSNVLRLGADGSIVDLGAVSGLPVPSNIWQTYDSGDVFPDGYLYIHQVTTHPELYKIDVTTSPPSLVETINLSQSIWLSDFAYNKVDNKIYGIGDQGEKFMIEPATWTVSTIGSNAPPASYGAAYTDNQGNVYIYKNNPGTFYQVDFGLNGSGTGNMTVLSTAPNVSFNDGASCRGTSPVASHVLGGNAWFDADGDGIQNDGAGSGIEHAAVELFDVVANTIIATKTTNITGEFTFTAADGLQGGINYEIRIRKPENREPLTNWALTSLQAGANTALDSDAAESGNYWKITHTTSAAITNSTDLGFGFVNSVAEGCLSTGMSGVSNEFVANSHSSGYDFEFSGQKVTGYCAERSEPDPLANDVYEVNALDRQGLTPTQRSKIARGFSAMTDPDIIFALAADFNASGWGEQQNLDGLMRYMVWYYTHYNEDIDALSSNLIDDNDNYTASEEVALKALLKKVVDRVDGLNSEPAYTTEQEIFWLWNMTDNSRQDMVVPAIYAAGLSCPVKGSISGTVYSDTNSNNSYDVGSEPGLNAITVNLLNDANGSTITTTSTAASGSYDFSNLDTNLTYRLMVDTADPDLPVGAIPGTDNPLTAVTVAANATTTNQDFGFDTAGNGGIPVCWAIDDDTANIYRFLPDISNPQPPTLIPTARANDGEGLTWRPSTNELYMWDGTTTYVMNAATGADARSFTANLGAGGTHVEGSAFYIDPVSKQEELWLIVENYVVPRRNDRYLVRIDPDNGSLITAVGPLTGSYIDGSVDYGKDTGGLAIDPNTKQFWITSDTSSLRGVYPLNPANGVVGAGVLFDPFEVDGEALEFADDGLFYTESDNGPSNDRYIWQVNGSTGSIVRAAGPFPGTGDVEAVACNGGASAVTTNLIPNPDLPNSCSLDIAFIVDASESVSGADISSVTTGMSNILDSLAGFSGGNYRAGIVEFASTATVRAPMTPVNTTNLTATFNPALANYHNGDVGDLTDYAIALQTTIDNLAPVDVVFFITDGNANRDSTIAVENEANAIESIKAKGNLLKGNGTHIYGVGITSQATTTYLQPMTDGPASSFLSPEASNYASADLMLNTQYSTFDDKIISIIQASQADCSSVTGHSVSGTVFEDPNYGGGAGRDSTASGTTGINGATLELYNNSGNFITSTTTGTGGTYSFPPVVDGTYYIRVVSSTVGSNRSGADGSELSVQTYRTDGTTAVTGEVGGRNPAVADSGAYNSGNPSTLNTTTFVFSGGSLDGGQAQSVQPVTVSGGNITGTAFGFNFSTIVNTNDSGQGSLRQFILNSNLLTGETNLQQVGQTQRYENSIFMIADGTAYPGTDEYSTLDLTTAGVAIITPVAPLPDLTSERLVFNALTQSGASCDTDKTLRVELDGSSAGAGANGMTLAPDNLLRFYGISIVNFANHGIYLKNGEARIQCSHIGVNAAGDTAKGNGGDGIHLDGTTGAKYVSIGDNAPIPNNIIAANSGAGIFALNAEVFSNHTYYGLLADGVTAAGNGSHGIRLEVNDGGNYSSSSRADKIAYNDGDGVSVVGDNISATVYQTTLYNNVGLGIDLNDDGVTPNDAGDSDTGPSDLLNFPVLTDLVQNGTNLEISLELDVESDYDYAIQLYDNPGGLDASGHGEGQVYLGYVVVTVSDGVLTTPMPLTLAAVPSDINNVTATTSFIDEGIYNTSEMSGVYESGCSLIVTTTADTSNTDNNTGSLRDAIECANATPGTDTISFNIPATENGYTNPDGISGNSDDYWSIQPASRLPFITEALVIAGDTQPGYSTKPVIEIDGSNAGSVEGLFFDSGSDGSTVRALIVNRFQLSGIELRNSSNHTIVGSYIGTDSSGLLALGNDDHGIEIADNSGSNTIGGTGETDGNIISGNQDSGIRIDGTGFNLIQGNFIGLGSDGQTAMGNANHGLYIRASGNQIGGVAASARNVIADSGYNGILLFNVSDNTIEGNYIGTNSTGNQKRGNHNFGIKLTGATENALGGSGTGAGNLISGNDLDGIMLEGSDDNTIHGNMIGTDASGNVSLGNTGTGITLRDSEANQIGGLAVGVGNLISANAMQGIWLRDSTTALNQIQGNTIGTNAARNAALGNGSNGIEVLSAQGNEIAENTIAYNQVMGVAVRENSAVNNSLQRNNIYANTGLGIDLAMNGISLNDAGDTDTGPNNLLNFPVLQQVIINGGNATLRGCAPAGSVIEFFEADVSAGGAASPGDNRFGLATDYGEGQVYLGSLVEGSAADIDSGGCSVPGSDGNNHTGLLAFQFSVPVPAELAIGDTLTATATLATAGTSEFSPVVKAIGGPPPIGLGSCSATGATDILFIVDNSGSITTSEYDDFRQTVQQVGTQLLADNPANRIAIAHFGGPSDTLVSGGQYVYLERDFSSTAMIAPVRQFANGGAYNSAWNADHLAGAIQQMRYALDGDSSTQSSYIISPLKETSRNLASPLQIVLMTDADRYFDSTPDDISMLIDPAGSGAEPDDGSDFTVYNQLKAEGVTFSVVSFNPAAEDISASAAIASVGGTYIGAIDNNPADPEGSQAIPRLYIPVTEGFELTAEQIEELVEGTAVCSSGISGTVFEDRYYGGGNGRPFGSAGTVGLPGATVEVYDENGAYVGAVSTGVDGSYKLPNLPDAAYYVRVVNSSVSSSRPGSNGSEMPVMTYRSNGTINISSEIGGRNPAVSDAPANAGTSVLDTNSFIFNAGPLLGQQVQSIQAITLTGSSVKNANFGFNFNTIVNTNDAGQGSLRQFVLNSNVLKSNSIQQNLPAPVSGDYQSGDTVSVFMIPLTALVAGEAVINLTTELNIEQSDTIIDGRVQTANIGNGPVILRGDGSGFVNGIYFGEDAADAVLRELAIENFGGSGVIIHATGRSGGDGVNIEQLRISNNGQFGVMLENGAQNNRIIASQINDNQWAGIANDGDSDNTFSQNSLSFNGGLGIDLGLDGVTANSNSDAWLNYPEVAAGSTVSSNGSRVVAYDFDIEVPANVQGYRIEFFSNTAIDPSGHGEGESYLGYVDIQSSGNGSENFKGSINANQAVPVDANIAVTLIEKKAADALGATSEFSAIKNGKLSVCTDLLADPDAPLPTITVDENSTEVSYLEAKDVDGNPVTYVISGGADADQFIIKPKPPGAIFDCLTIEFVGEDGSVIGTRNLDAVSSTRAAPPYIAPPASASGSGNYEAPNDSDGDNSYDLLITATDADGNQVTKPVTITVQNVNEKPRITNGVAVSYQERQDVVVIDLETHDPDAGDTEGEGLFYRISGGEDSTHFRLDPVTGELRFKTAPDYGSPADRNRDNRYEVSVRVMDSKGYSDSKTLMITVEDDPDSNGITLQARAFLQGAYDPGSGLMTDHLRSIGLLPVTQPYQREPFNHQVDEQVNIDLALVEGNNAIVDWVLLELRAASDPQQIITQRAVTLQRDGDLVDAGTGNTDLYFPTLADGSYYLSLRHRNHLGVMTASAISIAAGADNLVDFSDPELLMQGESARLLVATNDDSADIALLWSGDITQDHRLILSGTGSDLNPILSKVLTATENIGFNSSYQLAGYHDTDLNLDGVTLFMGPGNDANILLGNILLHPANDEFVSNFIVGGSLSQ